VNVIIFGFSTFYIFGLIGRGEFHCPNCGGDRDYEHRVARRFFTLFFIPVIPLNKLGEVVRCATCRTKYDPAVLQRPTTAQLAVALPSGMRALAATMLRAGGTPEAATGAAVEAVRRSGLPTYDLQQLWTDLNQPIEAVPGSLQALAAQLATTARERYLVEAVRIGLADAPLTPVERESIHWIASNLGLTAAHAEGVISTVEQTVQPG
jgi:zinc ribbon protein